MLQVSYCWVRSFNRLLKFTISGALLLNKDYGVLRSTVYYFIKCFSGEGDLEVKLLALCGKVMTFDNFGAYLFHLPTPPRPQTCGGMEAGKPGPDRVQHCCGAASSPSPSLPFSLSPSCSLSFFPPKQNRSELSQGNKNVLFLADGSECRLGNQINLLFLSLPLL